MRKYLITAYVGCETHTKEIEAKNASEAKEEAWNYAHKFSQYGNGVYLQAVKVTPVKSAKVK